MSVIHRMKRGIAYLLLFFVLLGFQTTVFGQDDPCDDPDAVRIYLPDSIIVSPGENICIPIFVDNFRNILTFLFSVNISSTTLSYTGSNTLTSGLPSFTSSDVVDLDIEPDILRVLWSAPNVVGEDLPDSTVLLELCFDVVGIPGVNGAIFLNDAGLQSSIDFIAEDPLTGQAIALPVCADPSPPAITVRPPDSANPLVYLTSACGTSGGLDNGVAEISIFNGTPPYTVTDDAGGSVILAIDQNVLVISNLPIGTRTYTVTDASGMVSDPLPIVITDTPPFTIVPTIREPRCPDDNNGRINLAVTGGRPFSGNKYYFDWGAQLVGVDQDELTMVSNGIYPITIIDSLGCSQRISLEVRREEVQVVIDNINNAFCENRENGQIIVSGTGGGPFGGNAYNYSLSGVTNSGTTYTDSRGPSAIGTFVTVPAGQYVITATDSVGRGNCALNPSDTITVGYSRSYTAQITGGDVNGCALGTERANIQITSTENLGNAFNYTIFDNNGTTVDMATVAGSSFTSNCLPPGQYTISISDDQTCSVDTSFRLVGCDIFALPLGLDPTCFGESDGSIILNASSSNGEIAYEWSTGDSTDVVIGLAAGDYSVTLTDTANCQIIVPITLFDPDPFTVTFTVEDIACPGGLGSITATPVGGEEPYLYFWTPDTTNNTDAIIVDIPAGTYNVTVEDDIGCTIIDSFTLTEPMAPDVAVTNITAPRCEGDPSGAALVVVTPDPTYTGPFSFLSNTGQNGAPNNFSVGNYPSGRNWVIFSDDPTGCIFDTVYFDIPDAPPLSINFDSSTIGEIACFGGMGLDGATVNLVGSGASGIQFTWPDGSVGNTQLGLQAGTYLVTLTAGSCLSVDTVVVTQPDSLEIFVDTDNSMMAMCGDETSSIVLDHRGGAPGRFIWDWRDANGLTVTRDSFFNDIPVGQYTVIGTDANNCQTSFELNITNVSEIGLVLGEATQPVCFGDMGTIIIDSAFGGVGSLRYQVNTSPAMDLNVPFQAPSGTYTVRVFDSNGCSADTMVTITTPETITLDLGSDIEVQLGQTGNLSATISSAVAIDSVFWNPSELVTCDNMVCNDVTINPVQDQIFTARVVDANGCVATDDVLVTVLRSEFVFVPNAFSPNALTPENRELRIFTGAGVEFIDFFRIFDRWGNLVHTEENLLPQVGGTGSWDGSFNGRPLDPGVFVYVVQVRFLGDNIPKIRKGDITLLR